MGNPSWELLGVEWKYRHGFVLFSCSSPVTLGRGQRREMGPTQPDPAQLIVNPSDVNVCERLIFLQHFRVEWLSEKGNLFSQSD